MYVKAIVSTLAAWFVGLVLDANIDFSNGFFNFRVLFPVLAMGFCILGAIQKEKEKQE